MSFPVIMGVDNNLKRILFSSLPPKNGLVGVLFILTGGARGFRAGDWPSSPESDFFLPSGYWLRWSSHLWWVWPSCMSWCGQWKASWERYNWCFIIEVWRGFGGAPGCQLPITDSQSTHQALYTQLWLDRAKPKLPALSVESPILCQLPEVCQYLLVCQYILLILVPICLLQSVLGIAGDGFFSINSK